MFQIDDGDDGKSMQQRRWRQERRYGRGMTMMTCGGGDSTFTGGGRERLRLSQLRVLLY